MVHAALRLGCMRADLHPQGAVGELLPDQLEAHGADVLHALPDCLQQARKGLPAPARGRVDVAQLESRIDHSIKSLTGNAIPDNCLRWQHCEMPGGVARTGSHVGSSLELDDDTR